MSEMKSNPAMEITLDGRKNLRLRIVEIPNIAAKGINLSSAPFLCSSRSLTASKAMAVAITPALDWECHRRNMHKRAGIEINSIFNLLLETLQSQQMLIIARSPIR